jgi:hypothetical protein
MPHRVRLTGLRRFGKIETIRIKRENIRLRLLPILTKLKLKANEAAPAEIKLSETAAATYRC